MALIHLFRKCNQRCVFCSYPAEDGGDEGVTLKGWLKEITLMPPGLVQISGGEPLLAGARNLCLLLAAVKKLGRRAELQTNALAAAELPGGEIKNIVRALNAANGYFNVNFPASTPDLDFKITRAAGGFEKRLAGVKRLIGAGGAVRLTHVISELNYKELPAFAAYAAKNLKGVAWLQFSYIKGLGRAGGAKYLPKYAAVKPYLEKALSICRENEIRCEVDHIPPCFLGEFYALNVDMVKMRDGHKGPHLEEKKQVPACRGCRFIELCPGPRKDYIAVHKAL
ncbi:MAG: radical SAM protein [Elusimicrobiales bacterium]|nr:radical SAM protein [Elusimicrobiales bacterium]